MKKLLLVITILTSGLTASAQSNDGNELSENSVYLDTGLGYGGQVSITYERQIYSGEKLTWSGHVGAGAAYKWSSDNDIFRTK